MVIKCGTVYLDFKYPIWLKKDKEVKVSYVKQGWLKPKRKVEKVKYFIMLTYIDHGSKERDFTWWSNDEAEIKRCYDAIEEQMQSQRNEIVDKTIEKALMGE